MDFVPLHPQLVHLPIALSMLMPFIAGGINAAIRRELLPPRAWVAVVLLQLLLLLSGFAAASTGENDAREVKRVVVDSAVEAHEEAADSFIALTGGVLALALAALTTTHKGYKQLFVVATIIGTVAVMYMGQRVGEAGGALVYVHQAPRAYINDAAPQPQPAAPAPTRPADSPAPAKPEP